jgi:hypothetical protein
MFTQKSIFDVNEIVVRPVLNSEEKEFRTLMKEHHYLKDLPKIGETIWYIAFWRDRWIALLTFSAAAWKCGVRDRWIGWDYRHQYDRLNLIANNSRFLILPDWHVPNLGSRILSLCQKRLNSDWLIRFSHPLLLLETFVDPERFYGTVYKAANWQYIGHTRGFKRTRQGYSQKTGSPKMVFVRPLNRNVQNILSQSVLSSSYKTEGGKLMLRVELMKSLPEFFDFIPDPRRAEGRRHRLSTVLSIAAAAVLCGMKGYKAIAIWARNLSQKNREHFRCLYKDGLFKVPGESTIRRILISVDPEQLNKTLSAWNETYGVKDDSLAIDGKTMCNAIDEEDRQTHIMSAVGHQSKTCYTQKKSEKYL